MPEELALLGEKKEKKKKLTILRFNNSLFFFDVLYVLGQKKAIFAFGMACNYALTFKSQGRPSA